jgi:hypothetical protein
MGKRSGVIEHEEELATLTLAELDAEIRRCKLRLKFATSRQLRKAFEKRVHWLERFREKHHEG